MTRYVTVARNIDPAADNKIHDDDVAQRYGFAGALVPGVELFALATSPAVARWGIDWFSRGLIDLRFRRPVYDGEQVTLDLEGDGLLRLIGPDGEVRSTGSAGLAADVPPPREYPVAQLPAVLAPEPLLGPLGTVVENGTTDTNNAYVEAIGEPHALYRDEAIAHPGLLLRLVNLVLMRNVELGPWVHTSSRCRLLAPARLPAQMQVHAEVTELFQRGGHDYVRYDALVLADDIAVMEVDHTAIYRLG